MTSQHKTVLMAVGATLVAIWAIKNVDALDPVNEFVFDD